MNRDFRHALIAAFERDFAQSPRKVEAWVMLNAHALPAAALADAEMVMSALTCEQGFRPLFIELERAGYAVTPLLEEVRSFDHAIVFASRVRAVNQHNFMRAWEMVKPGGQILVCGDRRSGIDGLRKHLDRTIEPPRRFSKYHALCLLSERSNEALPAKPGTDADERSGLFSAAGPDAGSQLLAQHISEAIGGRVADFGAGWGYLSQQILATGGTVTSLDLFEAEYQALEAAKSLLSGKRDAVLSFHWRDLTQEPAGQRFDWIIMNPPFHQGHAASREARPDIGRTFIEKAAGSLVSGGKLLMVANRTLPYEDTLTNCFSRWEKPAEEDGYKVLLAVR